jgi:di/tricarboxylate transporter
VQGSGKAIARLRSGGSMLVLDGTTDLPHTERANLALGVLAMVVLLAGTEILPMSISGLLGVGALLATNSLRWRHVGTALDTSVIMIMVASLALGSAMLETGAADFIAGLVIASTAGMAPAFVLSGLMLLIAIMTQVVSAKPAAALGTPIAISIAQQLHLPAEPFVVGVILAVNLTFATPIGHPTNVMIMTAGGYKFGDFLRYGVPLTVLMWLAFSLILPAWYGL